MTLIAELALKQLDQFGDLESYLIRGHELLTRSEEVGKEQTDIIQFFSHQWST